MVQRVPIVGETSEYLEIFVDGDWAGCPRTRKSTNGGGIMWNGACLWKYLCHSRSETRLFVSSFSLRTFSFFVVSRLIWVSLHSEFYARYLGLV